MFIQDSDRTPEELALTAVGLQMTIEITRLFDFAIRWSVNLETNMVSVQRLLALTKLDFERNLEDSSKVVDDDPVIRGKIDFNDV